jgi:dUTP pyrophosphatase
MQMDWRNAETIKIKYHENIDHIEQVEGSDWVDLRAAETVSLKEGEYRLISLGVSMELPKGYEAHVIPRSSTFKNFGVLQANSFGLIDNSFMGYSDIWKFPALATRDTTITKGDRICQFRIVKNQPQLNFQVVDTMKNQNRSGFGSTGVR